MDNTCDWVSTKLVEKVQAISKKPSLDSNIRGILEECLKKVDKQSIYLENGIFNFNLGEVAIILEQVTLIYGKKVDMLWDLLLNCQKRLLKFHTEESKMIAEQKQIEERMEKFKHRRRKKTLEKNVTHIKHIDYNSLMSQLSTEYNNDATLTLQSDVWHDFAQFPKDPEDDPIDRYLRPFFIPTSYPIHLNNEYVCDNAQVLSNYFHFEICDFIRQVKYNLLDDRDVGATGYDLKDDFMQTFLVENNIKLVDITEEQLKELHKYVEQQLLEKSSLQQKCKRLCPRRSSIMLTRLSQDIVAKYLKKDRTSVEESTSQSFTSNDSGFSELNSTENDNVSDNITNQQETSLSNSEGNSEHIQDSQSNVCNTSNEIQNIQSEITNTTDNVNNTCNEFIRSESIGSNNSTNEIVGNDNIENENGINKNQISNETLKTLIRKNKREKRKSKVELIEDGEIAIPKKRLCKKHDVIKLRKVITRSLEDYESFFYENYKPQDNEGHIMSDHFIKYVNMKQSKVLKIGKIVLKLLKEYELFFYKNYKPEDGEGTLIEPIFPEVPEQENLENNDHIILSQDSGICEDFETNLGDTITNLDGSIENEVTGNSENLDSTANNIRSNLATSTPVQGDTENTADASRAMDEDIMEVFREQQRANEKYFQWKMGVDKKLAATDKNDFNIHEYGTQILSMLPDKEPVDFNKIMMNKKPCEVARLVIASLQLVNTSNIKLLNETPGQVANDTLQFQLLSRDRHHESLDSYIAPSLENRAVALNKIRNIQRCQPSTSTVLNFSNSLPCKKKKLDYI